VQAQASAKDPRADARKRYVVRHASSPSQPSALDPCRHRRRDLTRSVARLDRAAPGGSGRPHPAGQGRAGVPSPCFRSLRPTLPLLDAPYRKIPLYYTADQTSQTGLRYRHLRLKPVGCVCGGRTLTRLPHRTRRAPCAKRPARIRYQRIPELTGTLSRSPAFSKPRSSV